MADQRCENCRFYDPPLSEESATFGQCRRYPPALVVVSGADVGDENVKGGLVALHPDVWPGEWCGEWQPVTVGVRKAGPRQRRIQP